MPSRRQVLATTGTAVASLAGCLASSSDESDGDGGAADDADAHGSSGDVGATDPLGQFQSDARNSGVADVAVPDAIESRWSTRVEPIKAGLALVGDRLLAAASGSLVALDVSDGDVLWETPVGHTLGGTPAVTSEVAYLAAWNGGELQARGVAAIDLEDGTVRWRAVPDVDVTTAPTLADGSVYVGGSFNSEHVIALDATDGSERWRFPAGRRTPTPAVADGLVVAAGGEEHAAYGLDADGGEERWRFETGDWVQAAPTVHDDTVYVGTRDGRVHALAATDGEERWTKRVGNAVRNSVAATDEAVYVPTDRSLVALTPDGTELWSAGPRGSLPPTVTADGLLAADRSLACLDHDDGSERWRHSVPSRTRGDAVFSGIQAPPVVGDGGVYVGGFGGDVIALRGSSG